MIRFVLLDVDNTLLDFHRCAESAMKHLFEESGWPYDAATFDTFTRINNGLWAQIETGDLTKEQLYDRRWNLVFEALGIKSDGRAFEQRFLDRLAVEAVPVDGARELLAYLAPKYTVCVASNAPHEQQIKRLQHSGLYPYIQEMFTSERLGVSKPAKAFFEACFEVLRPAGPDEVIIIGDSLTADIRGGKDVGIQTCWYNPHGETAPDNCRPDSTVKTLYDIQQIL